MNSGLADCCSGVGLAAYPNGLVGCTWSCGAYCCGFVATGNESARGGEGGAVGGGIFGGGGIFIEGCIFVEGGIFNCVGATEGIEDAT